jgi:hypothetical protein
VAGPLQLAHSAATAVTPSTKKGPGSMGAIMDFLGQTWVMVTMGVALVGLIVLMVFLRMKPRDEE